jgi:hypothetical protein
MQGMCTTHVRHASKRKHGSAQSGQVEVTTVGRQHEECSHNASGLCHGAATLDRCKPAHAGRIACHECGLL